MHLVDLSDEEWLLASESADSVNNVSGDQVGKEVVDLNTPGPQPTTMPTNDIILVMIF